MGYLPPDEHQRRVKLYRQGLLDEEIAAIVGVNRFTIGKWRNSYNLPYHKPSKVKDVDSMEIGKSKNPCKNVGVYKAMLRKRFLDPL